MKTVRMPGGEDVPALGARGDITDRQGQGVDRGFAGARVEHGIAS